MRRYNVPLCLLSVSVLAAGAGSAIALSAAQAATSPDTIFGSASPALVDSGDAKAVELGVKFTASEAGSITGIRFYKAAANTGTHIGSLWSASGALLAQATFTGETASGWQNVSFAQPVAISAGTTYVGGYLAPAGHYSATADGLSSAVSSGPLTAVGNSTSPNGVYAYASTSTFPASSYQADNYWVDVDFTPSGTTSTTTTTATPTTTTAATTTTATTTTATTPTTTTTTTTSSSSSTSGGSSGGSGGGTGSGTDCFASPGGCGYPDPNAGNVGATSACSSLPASGSVTASTSGETIQNLDITGTLTISAPNVTVNNVCVTTPGDYDGNGVNISSNATNALIENSTVAGTSASGTGVLNTGVWNASNVASVTLNKVIITNAAEDYHGAGTVENSYLQAGGFYTIPDGTDDCSTSGGCPAHNEDIYMSDTSVTLNHDTLLNSASQTAVLFGDNDGGSKGTPGDNKWVVTNNLIAGGGYLAYWNASASGVGSSTMDVENNRFARCDGATDFDGWGTQCTDATATSSGTGGDHYGYYPFGGYYGSFVYGYCPGSYSGQTWSGNVWDDNNSAVTCD